MSTPFQDDVKDVFLERLEKQGLSEGLITYLGEAFDAERLPSAEEVALELREQSGDKLA